MGEEMCIVEMIQLPKKGLLPYVTTRVSLESIMPSEISHSQKKFCMIPFI